MFDIDTSEFKKWWYASYPSLHIPPNSQQMALLCHDENNISISGWRINVAYKTIILTNKIKINRK